MRSLEHIPNMNCQKSFFYTIGLGAVANYLPFDEDLLSEPSMDHCASEWLIVPKFPIAFGFFQFIYSTNLSFDNIITNNIPTYICFNASRCPGLLFCSIDIGISNGLHCCETTNLVNASRYGWWGYSVSFQDVIERCTIIGTDQTCSHPSLFHCSSSSKCISKHRLVDGYKDCYHGEDELFSACQLNDSSRFICPSNPNKCLSIVSIEDGKKDCQNGEDEITENEHNIIKGKIQWGYLCDGENNFLSMNKSNDTDETHCEWWPCNTSYFRCDNVWHCFNGIDEFNCPENKCLSNEYECGYPSLARRECISIPNIIEKQTNCNTTSVARYIYEHEPLIHNSTHYFSWNQTKCLTLDQICSHQISSMISQEDVCLMQPKAPSIYDTVIFVMNPRENIRCIISQILFPERKPKRFLITSRLNESPSISQVNFTQQTNQFNNNTMTLITMPKSNFYCHRGIPIQFRNTSNSTKCLCPPSYFGHRCQWQNQRISLTLQIIYRTLTYNQSVFQLIIMIINEQQQQITPYHEQITYSPKHDCTTKFNIYLLYPDRPKNISANYSLHIDIFDKVTLTYWASWHLSIPFQFLPVNRIATQLFIPDQSQIRSCSLSCGTHGRCIRYINKNFSYFCQCNDGYSGSKCEIKHNRSLCSSDSFSLTSSICICPLNKFGPRCYLKHQTCQSSTNPCHNNGICVPIDDRISLNQFRCLCEEGFYGTICEYSKNRIDIELNDTIIGEISALRIHFITAIKDKEHQHTTTFKRILSDQNTITLYVKQPFNLVLVDLFNQNYYLIVVREKFIASELIQTKLMTNQQCISIQDLLNDTLKSYSYLDQIKYYPLLCRQNKQLTCFYDKNYMCLCDLDRFSNCFLFNHKRKYDCQGYIKCENGGECFQDNITCPSVSICVCSECYYGTKCQFSTKGFLLSLDYILGYHIKPNLSFSRQPIIIKITVAITTIMFSFGFLNGILSILTFRIKKTRESGCGFYLFISSWISIVTICILIIKFWLLVLSQMTIIINRTFLTMNCILLDMMINVVLALNDWFNAFISIERVITVHRGIRFNQSKSKRIAKWTTLIIIMFTILTRLSDPLHRHLIDDINEDEKRTWCLVKYSSSSIEIFSTFMTLFHFLVPFAINLTSTIIMVILISRHRSTVQPKLTFGQHLKLQMNKYKPHLIALFGLILLALPRLIISFVSGCMKSPRNSWLFLCGYLMSFLPSMLTLLVSILPSKLYKDEFVGVMSRTVRRVRNRFWRSE